MENENSTQSPIRKLRSGSPIQDITERVIQGNKARLRTELACEARRAILIQSQLAALQSRFQQRSPSASHVDPESVISILESSIREKKVLIEARKAELFSLTDAHFSDAITKSPTKLAVERQISECTRRIAQLKDSLEGDNIDKDQELIDLKARNVTLIQLKNGELGELQQRRQKCAARLDALLNRAESAAEGKVNAMNAAGQTASPLKRELQKLRRRKAELLLFIEKLQNGIPEQQTAEASNSKMRARLRNTLRSERPND
jgi:hypothetical protein